jgi:hypothetical protein
MGKLVDDAVLDAALDTVALADFINVCKAEPSDYTDAIQSTGEMLARTAMVVGDGNGDYTISNGDASGRKIRMTAKNNINITNTGQAEHIALTDSGNSRLVLVTTCTAQQLTAGNTVSIPAWDDEIADPI